MLSQIPALVLLFLAPAVLAANNQNQPFYQAQASKYAVNYLMKYRNPNVPEAQASQAAAEIADGILKQPAATKIINSGVQYAMVNGFNLEPTQALKLVSQASSAYDVMATKPAYKSYANFVAAQTTAFDFNRALSDAQSAAFKYAANGKANQAVNKVVSTGVAKYNDMKQNPAGIAAIASGKSLAKKVAHDFNVDTVPTGVKQLSVLKTLLN